MSLDTVIEQNLARQVRTQAATLRRVRAERDAAEIDADRFRRTVPRVEAELFRLRQRGQTLTILTNEARIDALQWVLNLLNGGDEPQ